MELLKNNPIIDLKYKPSLGLTYLEYFNRAMVFAQTNYQYQLDKLSRTQLSKLSPTQFIEEYIWIICCDQNSLKVAADLFYTISSELNEHYYSFWETNNFSKINITSDKLANQIGDVKFKAIVETISIINKAIKLFGWEYYRKNFLNIPSKLLAFPIVSERNSELLSLSIGASSQVSSFRLHHLAEHWHFSNTKELCSAIQKYIPMQPKIIELILWYAHLTFPE